VEHRVGRRAKPLQAVEVVEVADDRDDAVRTELPDVLDAARETLEANFAMQEARGAQRHIAAADQEYPHHVRACSFAPAHGAGQHQTTTSPCHTRLP
jgi:regulator of PEP synthase PpsR (kinase-PPPase family)